MADGTAPPAVIEERAGPGDAICAQPLAGSDVLCGDGRLAIDNNVAERALRTIAITRKNFLFLGSEAGGERAATLYTVLESAKLNGIDPEAYLADVIDRMARGHPINRLAELLPWNWHRPAAKLAA
jgi:transposase